MTRYLSVRRFMPAWLKDESTEFLLEFIAAMWLGAELFHFL